MDNEANNYFSYSFGNYIRQHVLKQYKDNIEAYGYFDGVYVKLSSQIQETLNGEYKVMISQEDRYGISECQELIYSKQLHGDKMLRSISPSIVSRKCNMFFREAYEDIKKFVAT